MDTTNEQNNLASIPAGVPTGAPKVADITEFQQAASQPEEAALQDSPPPASNPNTPSTPSQEEQEKTAAAVHRIQMDSVFSFAFAEFCQACKRGGMSNEVFVDDLDRVAKLNVASLAQFKAQEETKRKAAISESNKAAHLKNLHEISKHAK